MRSGGNVGRENISQRRERHSWEDVPKEWSVASTNTNIDEYRKNELNKKGYVITI
jgi:uncharacterized protein YijF (DUF1287 family)